MEFDKEHTELILDKVHLAMSKKDPYWQEKILKGSESELKQFHKLQRLALEQVLKSAGIEIEAEEWEELGKEFKELKAEDLATYALGKAAWLKGKKARLEKEKDKIEDKINEETDSKKPESKKRKEGAEDETEHEKNQDVEEVQKAKKRTVGEEWTQPSGRKVKKIKEGVIVPIQKERQPTDKEDTKQKNTKQESRKQHKSSKQKESSLTDSLKSGSEIVKESDKAIDETKKGGFAEQPSKVAEKVAKPKSKQEKIAEKVKNAKGKSQDKKGKQDITDNPSELSFSQIRRIEQYTEEKNFNRKQIDELKRSFIEHGYLRQFPMLVDKQDGKWTVVSGNHRYEAVRELVEEGQLPSDFKIPVVTEGFATDIDRLAAQVIENQRRDVLPTDDARAYKKMQNFGLRPEEIAKKLGKTLGEINKKLALMNLSKELFKLVEKRDRTLPLGVAESIGMFGVNDNGLPNETIQIKAFKWYLENKNKINTPGPVAMQSYIKELKSGDFNFDLEASMSDTQREALRSVGSAEKAQRNAKMIENMLKNLQQSYQRILGDSVSDLNPQTVNELSASIAAQGNVHADKTLATIDVIMQDLAMIKEAFAGKIREIEGNSKIPMMFSKLRELVKSLSK
jgi:ParB/RepB/Spo0J family partition protein